MTAADAAGEGGEDLGVAEVELCLAQLRLARGQRRLRLLLIRERLIEGFLADIAVAEQGPRPLQVDLGRHDEIVIAAALDRSLLGERAPLGREDAGGALPLAVLVADLVALMGVARGRGDNGDPGHVPCLLVTGTG